VVPGALGPSAARLVLASASPQRKAILEQLGVAFDVHPADVEERTEGDPAEVVVENARRKVEAVEGDLVLGCDTEVVLDGRIFGKAQDEAEAESYLRALSGRIHEVHSGIALRLPTANRQPLPTAYCELLTAAAVTKVTFRKLTDAEIAWYLGTDEWQGRAGAYAIQGRGSALVERIEGDFWNVVGLPVPKLMELAPDLVTDRD
jgi:septum formation protein